MKMRGFLSVFLFLSVLTLSNSLDYKGLRIDFEANLAKWKSQGWQTYSLTFQLDCFCSKEYRDPVKVQVVNSQVKLAVYDKESLLHGKTAKVNGSVESLFDKVKEAIEKRLCDIKVSYDDKLGYPTSVYTTPECGLSDMPTHRLSNVKPGMDKHFSALGHGRWPHHHGHHHGHYLRFKKWYCIGGSIGLLFVVILIVVALVKCCRSRRAVNNASASIKKAGNVGYVNLQEEEEVEEPQVGGDIKKVPLV